MKLSIFIFCYERPNYLRRQLEVFKKLEILAHIYLLDGSKNKKKKMKHIHWQRNSILNIIIMFLIIRD